MHFDKYRLKLEILKSDSGEAFVEFVDNGNQSVTYEFDQFGGDGTDTKEIGIRTISGKGLGTARISIAENLTQYRNKIHEPEEFGLEILVLPFSYRFRSLFSVAALLVTLFEMLLVIMDWKKGFSS